MKHQDKIKLFLITLSLYCAGPLIEPLTAADPEPAAEPAKPVPWHVSNAEILVPVKVPYCWWSVVRGL